MEVTTAKQVRFSRIIEVGGKPEAYLPFSDPEKDPAFMRAAKDTRVVTIKQDPAAKRKDFGIVGFVKEKYATYLIFPNSLKAFSGQRVIGIDYSVLETADVRVGGKVPPPGKPKQKKKEKPSPEVKIPAPKPEKPKPQPRRYSVDVRLTTVEQKTVEVTAWNEREAKAQAVKEIEARPEFDRSRTTAKAVKARAEN